MSDPKIAPEMAEQEFDRWAEGMDLSFDVAKMDAEDATAFNKMRDRIVGGIVTGSVIINDNDEAVYTPWRKNSKSTDAITFHERSGASLMAMDGKKKGQDVAKTYAVMGDMCKVAPKVFAGLVGPDIKMCEALFALLMD